MPMMNSTLAKSQNDNCAHTIQPQMPIEKLSFLINYSKSLEVHTSTLLNQKMVFSLN